MLFMSLSYGDRRYLHSFPTLRSSDLGGPSKASASRSQCYSPTSRAPWSFSPNGTRKKRGRSSTPCRSEEHTSELQSLRHLVCRLLLEKKKEPHASATERA